MALKGEYRNPGKSHVFAEDSASLDRRSRIERRGDSDESIVVLTRGNSRTAKGLMAIRDLDIEPSAGLRAGQQG